MEEGDPADLFFGRDGTGNAWALTTRLSVAVSVCDFHDAAGERLPGIDWGTPLCERVGDGRSKEKKSGGRGETVAHGR